MQVLKNFVIARNEAIANYASPLCTVRGCFVVPPHNDK